MLVLVCIFEPSKGIPTVIALALILYFGGKLADKANGKD
jgi:hypothetical protein